MKKFFFLFFKLFIFGLIFYQLIFNTGLKPTFGQYAPTNTPTLTPTRTPTPTPTPIPRWIKLKNTSFSSANDLNNPIPAIVSAYDGDDDGTRYFIIASTNYDPGLVTAKTVQLNGAPASTKDWQKTLTKTVSMTPSNFLSYVKSRKEYKTFTSVDEITSKNYNNEILVINGDLTINDTNKTNFNNKNLVIVVNGNLTFNLTLFSPNNASTAFLTTGTTTFANTTTEVHGIFVAPNIDLGTNANQGIKIVGNLAALTNLINGRLWSVTSKPSVFIIFDQSQYFSLFSLLGVARYDWQQLK